MRLICLPSVIAALAALFAAAPAVAVDAGAPAPAAVDATLAEQSVAIDGPIAPGEPFELTLRIEHPAGSSVLLPEAFEPPRWRLIDSEQNTVQREGTTTTVAVLRFSIFRPGQTTLAPFDIAVTSVAGDAVLRSEPLTVKVVATLPDEPPPTFSPPRPAVAVWVDDYTLAWAGGGAALLGLLGLLAFAAARRRALMPPPPAPPREAWEVALEKLGALAADDFVARGEYMIFWVRLSEAIREYLGRRYGFPPTELTTSEILGELAGTQWPHGLDEADVADFLRRCDRVKFGGVVPSREESASALRRAFSIVELTRPRVTPTEAPAALTDDGEEPEAATAPADETSAVAADDVTTPPRNRWAPPEDYTADEEEP